MVEILVFIIYLDSATGGCGRKLAEQQNYDCCEDVSFGTILEIQVDKVL